MVDELNSFRPDVVVTFGAACLWGMQTKNRTRFLIEPEWKPSDALKKRMEYQLEYEEESEWEVTDELINDYEAVEDKLSQKTIEGDCWIIDEEPCTIKGKQYENCHLIITESPVDISRWSSTCLFPIIREVIDGTYHDDNGKQVLYGKKFNI